MAIIIERVIASKELGFVATGDELRLVFLRLIAEYRDVITSDDSQISRYTRPIHQLSASL